MAIVSFFRSWSPLSTFASCLLLWFAITACTKKSPDPFTSAWSGSGVVVYQDYEPLASKQLRLFYYVPEGITAESPIVFIFHGAERNAIDYRNAVVSKAAQYKFIAVVPEFSEADFPGVSSYQIGNVYIDGDDPSPATLNPAEEWSFSLIEPLFAYVKSKTSNNSSTYSAIGHSAGAQFLHRFLLFKPEARFNKAVVSAAGWYTATDPATDFPYGLNNSPLAGVSLQSQFARNITVQVGSLDNNPNASSLRRDAQADEQGTHRLARAQYFYATAADLAAQRGQLFNWQLRIEPGLNHGHVAALGAAADHLFE